jgi:hypothetical protein
VDPVGRQRPADGVHTFALGEGAVLYAGVDQELHVLSPAAALVWSALAGGASSEELAAALSERFGATRREAAAWVADQLAHWRARGWVAPASRRRGRRPAAREGRTRRGRAPRQPHRARPRGERVMHCRLLTTHFALAVPSDPIATRLERVLAHLGCVGEGPVDVALEVRAERDGLRVLEDGVPVHAGLEASQIAPIVKLCMRNAAMNRHRYFMQLHAGAVLGDDGVLLFPGESGSGKTTLTASLAPFPWR